MTPRTHKGAQWRDAKRAGRDSGLEDAARLIESRYSVFSPEALGVLRVLVESIRAMKQQSSHYSPEPK